VAGDHTRTISVAAPTVGGLMKFAVKTQTCLGCKTPLPKGVSSQCIKCLTFRCQGRCLSKLYPQSRRTLPETISHNQWSRDAFLPLMDSMSTMSREFTPRRHLHFLWLSNLL